MKKEETLGQWRTERGLKKGLMFSDLARDIITKEPKKSGDILKKRFGIGQKKTQTLEEIGRGYGVTRERVRQIIGDSMRRIGAYSQNEPLREAEEKIIFTIRENRGIITVRKLVEMLSNNDKIEANSIIFFGALSGRIISVEEKGVIKKSWAIHDSVVREVKEVDSIAKSIFQNEKVLFPDEELARRILEKYKGNEKESSISHQQILNFVHTLEQIKQNKLGKWGMSHWKEINLKGTRERVYMALQEKGEPMHFSEIAKFIDTYNLGKRKAHPQTVHNELIKDERFVLVGRGTYALAEWGYIHGTVRDVLEEILSKSRGSLSQKEIMKQALKMRRVKRSTIVINLNNSKLFNRKNDFYSLKK